MEALASTQPKSTLPSSIKYANLPSKAISGNSHLQRFASSNGSTFDPASNNVIRIPVSASGINTFLDGRHSYLEMHLTAVGKTTDEVQELSGGLFAVIQRLRILSRSNGAVIQDTNNYNVLHNLMHCYQANPASMKSQSAMTGVAGDMRGSGNDPSAAGYETTYIATEGTAFAGNAVGDDIHLTTPFVSGFLSNTKGLAIPVGLGGFELEITLATSGSCMKGATDVLYKVSSCHYWAPIFQVTGDNFQSSMMQLVSSLGGISFTGSNWQNYVGSFDAGAGEKSLPIPISARSLKSIMTVARTSTTVELATADNLTNWLPNATTIFNYRVGDQMYPSSRINVTNHATLENTNSANAYNQCLFATGQQNSIHAQTLISRLQFNNDKWAYAADVEKYLNESGNVSSTGVNTLDGSVQVSLEVENTPAAGQRTDTFCLTEQLFHVDASGNWSVSR